MGGPSGLRPRLSSASNLTAARDPSILRNCAKSLLGALSVSKSIVPVSESSGQRADAPLIRNDTAVNVVVLLKDQVGAFRNYRLWLDAFSLDADLVARDVEGRFRLIRLSDEIIAKIQARGVVELECQRCLSKYDQPFAVTFDEEFRISIDLATGVDVEPDEDEERFSINDNHELDIAEPLRQEILVSLPMRPVCGDDCPGPDRLETESDAGVDDRFAALAKLLGEE